MDVKEYPPMVKKSVEELQNEDDDPLGRTETNFDTHRQLISTATSNLRYNVNEPEEPSSLMITQGEKVKKKKRRKEKKSKKSKKHKKSKDREVRRASQPVGLQKKATIIVSKRIVRQATASKMSLGEYIRHNKLRLVDPSQEDLRRVESRQGSSKKIMNIKGSNKDSFYAPSKSNYEEDKYDSFDSYRRQNPQIRADPRPMKAYKRKSTLEYNDLFDKDMRRKINKQMNRSATQNLNIKKLERPKTMRNKEPEVEKPKIPSRKLTLNDIMKFIFLVVLTVFGIVLSCIEFSYYAESV